MRFKSYSHIMNTHDGNMMTRRARLRLETCDQVICDLKSPCERTAPAWARLDPASVCQISGSEPARIASLQT